MEVSQVLRKIKARSLLDYAAEELWDILTGQFILIFDNGEELTTNAYETIYSSYAWDFHRQYPETPLLLKHHMRVMLMNNTQRLSTSSDLNLIGACKFSVYDTYGPERVELDPDLSAMAYAISNKQYVDALKHTGEFAMSIDLLDFMEVLDEPSIFEVNRNIERTQESIQHAHKVIENVLDDHTKLRTNAVAMEYRSKLLKAGQVLQCVGPRGALTDMNSRIFRVPIARGYVEGIRSLYDSIIEARSASKSSFYAAEALKQSEYFSRRLQFVAQTVQHLHRGDCGTNTYLEWTMRDKAEDDNGNKTRPSDLMLFHGKYYLEGDGKLHMITPKSRSLIGRKLRIRSPLFCAHPDPVGICATCYGDLALSVPKKTNIGQLSSTYMAKQASQNLLSNKHLDRNATLDKIQLSADDQKYVKVGRDNSSYLLADALRGKKVNLIIKPEQAQSLQDIFDVEDVRDLPEKHVTELDTIGIQVFTQHSNGLLIGDGGDVKVAVHGRLGSFTHEMLQYIRDHRWKMEGSNYSIDMADWDWDDTVIILPQKHFNNSDHVDNVAKMLESRVSEMRNRDKAVSPSVILQELADYVNWKLDVNIALLEVVLYSTMIVSAEDNDYSLPKPWTKMGVGVQSKTMENRSLGVAYAYEDQYERIVSPTSYLETNRIDHPFDGIFMPFEVHGHQ